MAATISTVPLWKSGQNHDDDFYHEDYFPSLQSLRNSGAYIDCILTVEGKQIPCHKIVLAAASPYFHAMFTCGLMESTQREIDIKGFSFEIVSIIISYIYSGTFDMEDQDLGTVLLAVSMFQIENLESFCTDLIKIHIKEDPVKAISAYHFCRVNGSVFTDIEEVSKSLILRRFYEIYLREELIILTSEELRDLISNESLMVDNEWQVVQSILKWIERKRENEEVTETDICCLIEALHFDRLTSMQVDSMKHHKVLQNYDIVLNILSEEGTGQNDHDTMNLRSGQQRMKCLVAGMFFDFTKYPPILSKAIDITCDAGKVFIISSPKVHKDIYNGDCLLGVLEASMCRPVAKPYWLIIDNKSDCLQLYVYDKFENVWSKEFDAITVSNDAEILTSTICKDYLLCIIKESEISFMLYCICLLKGQWIKRNIEKDMKPAMFDSPGMVTVEDYIYIVDVGKIGTYKYHIDAVTSSPRGKLQITSCSPIPVAPMTSVSDDPVGYISAVFVQDKMYSMYSRDFFLNFEQLKGYCCPKVCIYDPAMNIWETMDNTPAFSTLGNRKESLFGFDNSGSAISFSKLISDGNDLFLYQHQKAKENMFRFGHAKYMYTLFKYNMKEKCWKLFEELPNLLQQIGCFSGKNVIIADLLPTVLHIFEAEFDGSD